MAGITLEQADELIGITMEDFPWPSAADMLGCFNIESDFDAKACMKFIMAHYTPNEINAGFKERIKHIEFVAKLFGGK